MKRQPRILAGTAIGLFMASAPLGAMPLPSGMASTNVPALPLVRVQAECQEGEAAEACAARQGGGQQAPEPQQPQAEQPAPEPQAEQPRRKQREAPAEAAPQEAAPEPQAEQPRKKRQPVEEAAPQEAAPEPQAEQPRKKRQPVEEAAPQEAAPEPQAEQPKHKKRQPVEEAAPQEAAPEPQAEQPKHKKRQPAAEEAAPAEQPAQKPEVAPQPEPQAEQPAPKHNKKAKAPTEETQPVQTPEVAPQPEPQPKAEKPAEKPAEVTPEQVPTPTPSGETPTEGKKPGKHKPAEPATEQPATGQPATEQPAIGQPATEQPATGEKPAEKPAEGAQPAEKPAEGAKPAGEQSSGQPAEKPATAEQPATGEKPATAEQPATGEQPVKQVEERPTMQREQPANPNDAPILDSQKEEVAPVEAGGKPPRGKPGKQGEQGQTGEQTAQPQPVDLGPPPTDDKSAQEAAQPVEIKPVIAEQGTRLDKAPDFDARRRPRPEGSEVLREIGDRIIIQINNQVIVESNDRPRMTRDAQEVYYDELPGGRTREVIVRDNGNQIVTVRNRFGDIVRRSRITPDGREYVLNYVDDQYYQDMDEWRDPGLDLPPLQLRIPRQQYILDAQYVDDPEAYYDFLERPPVERVKRLYSVDEVKRSARVRDIARRVDLDTLNFEFGSASISEAEVAKLEGVANAIEKLLKKNPAETFLIEGHTDAVGSDVANLALSDRRAESVADALTNVFGIPPENLTTQGYGERYLKVKTEARERENRRVAIRRITPLVAPVASAN